MPVSTWRAGSGLSEPSSWRLNSMNTRFQSSMKRSLPALTPRPLSAPSRGSVPGPPRSMWISVQGPQGPVSPISQKLSFFEKGRTCDGSMSVRSRHRRAASSSAGRPSPASPAKTVAHRRSLGRPQTLVRSSQAQAMASSLK
jgi:hypothetical protein